MKSICVMREIYRAIENYELEFEQVHGIGLNEAMALCCIRQNERLSSGEIADKTGLKTSHCSKIIRSIEDEGYVQRIMGKVDRRQMYFILTRKGNEMVDRMTCDSVAIPDLLLPLFQKMCADEKDK